ncbi:MAG: RNA polymerase sigma factor [Eubacteriales bacterium]
MSEKNISEEALIFAAAGGDRNAFGELVRIYEKLVYNTIRVKVRSEEDAFDISQEVFIKIWRALPNWRGECRFSTWIYKVSINCCYDHLRKVPGRKTESLWSTDDDGEEREIDIADETVEASPEKSLDRNETITAVRAAIAKLSDEQREIVVLRDIDGHTYGDRQMLDLEIGTVKSRLNRARANLRKCSPFSPGKAWTKYQSSGRKIILRFSRTVEQNIDRV